MERIKRLVRGPEIIEVTEPYDTIREIIERRLKVGNDDCLITVKLVAKTAMKELGQDLHWHTSKTVCRVVLQVLAEYYIVLWDYRSQKGSKASKANNVPCRHIYRVRRWV